MEVIKLFDAEYKFMTLIWEREPINSTELARLCEEKLGWKKSTTYTILRKLRDRNILENENAVVTSKVKQSEIRKYESEALLDKVFDNSLPKFLTAFLGGRKLTEKEAEELRRIIDSSREDE